MKWIKTSERNVLFALRDDWRKIPGLSTAYEVNSQGMVRSLPRKITRKNGTVQRFKGTILSIFKNSSGYNCVKISDSETGKRLAMRCHRAVAEAFIPNPENKPEVNHIDGDKTNADISNLEWVTSRENKKHAWDTGLRNRSHLPNKIGEDKHNAKLTDAKVIEMRNLKIGGLSYREIAEAYGVCKRTCIDAVKGRNWSHVKPALPQPPEE